MPFNMGGPELVIVLVVILIVFGAGKLPTVMRDFGAGMREFRRAQSDSPASAEPAGRPSGRHAGGAAAASAAGAMDPAPRA